MPTRDYVEIHNAATGATSMVDPRSVPIWKNAGWAEGPLPSAHDEVRFLVLAGSAEAVKEWATEQGFPQRMAVYASSPEKVRDLDSAGVEVVLLPSWVTHRLAQEISDEVAIKFPAVPLDHTDSPTAGTSTDSPEEH